MLPAPCPAAGIWSIIKSFIRSITPPFRTGLVGTPLYKQNLCTTKTRDPAVNRPALTWHSLFGQKLSARSVLECSSLSFEGLLNTTLFFLELFVFRLSHQRPEFRFVFHFEFHQPARIKRGLVYLLGLSFE